LITIKIMITIMMVQRRRAGISAPGRGDLPAVPLN
jgi:hypothetical protein